MFSIPQSSDQVLIDTLHLSSLTLGPDCWGKTRPQPASLDVSLHLAPKFLVKSGETDDVADSVHYGLLTKKITQLVASNERGFSSAREMLEKVAAEASELAGREALRDVRVVLRLEKAVLLAEGGLVADATFACLDTLGQPLIMKEWRIVVRGLVLPVLIGVNPPERLAKQRVRTDLVFYERDCPGNEIGIAEYQKIVDGLVTIIDASSYLTLEKFVHEIARAALQASEVLQAITVKARKPSALSFADNSGVEVTRLRQDFGL